MLLVQHGDSGRSRRDAAPPIRARSSPPSRLPLAGDMLVVTPDRPPGPLDVRAASRPRSCGRLAVLSNLRRLSQARSLRPEGEHLGAVSSVTVSVHSGYARTATHSRRSRQSGVLGSFCRIVLSEAEAGWSKRPVREA